MSTEKNFSIRLALISLFMLISATMMAQVTVTGSVIDMQGEPIVGASVRESGTRSAAVTDVDGKYAINVQDANAILNVSFIGYQSQTVRIAGRRLVTITLVMLILAKCKQFINCQTFLLCHNPIL